MNVRTHVKSLRTTSGKTTDVDIDTNTDGIKGQRKANRTIVPCYFPNLGAKIRVKWRLYFVCSFIEIRTLNYLATKCFSDPIVALVKWVQIIELCQNCYFCLVSLSTGTNQFILSGKGIGVAKLLTELLQSLDNQQDVFSNKPTGF